MRAFGIELSPNVRSIRCNRRELTKEERVAIVTARAAGVTRRVLAENFNCDVATISRIVKRFQNHGSIHSLPRSGRPKKLSTQQVRYIRQLIKRNPHISWAALIGDSPVGVSKSTLKRVMGKDFRRKWRSVKRVILTAERAVTRLAYARQLRHSQAMLLEGAYSDESSVQTLPNKPNGWVFRAPKHKYDKELINIQAHVKAEITIMVWGMIWKGGRSLLVIMTRDHDAPRNGYTASSYIWALEEGLEPYYRPGTFFLQDNAKIHVASKTKDWLESRGIWVVDHPPHSPDLNPIEHVWKKMKEILCRDFPELHFLERNDANIAKVSEALKVA
ncbi:DDE superfamily endonuclease-domain-containing protein [Corynascus novoguineensis]|uniref:DDE superfamily endonuclease-domain-containing protein n=1 Tax=Corynascus novoguineensis TaxID=1126955 RepID=A0AAN7CJE5_9PEZI|nr:DDE superfamily endonuclease-domain-containing protein [Corynascus novoguineensis]